MHPLAMPTYGIVQEHISNVLEMTSDAVLARHSCSPLDCRPARSKSGDNTLPYVLSPEQATLVLRRNLADVYLGLVNQEDGRHRPISAAHVRFGNEGESSSRPARVEQSVRWVTHCTGVKRSVCCVE